MSLANMTLRQKVGQTMMFGFHGMEPTEEITRMIRDHHVGGIIVFARNIGRPAAVLKLTVALQKIAYEAGHSHPLLISIDQENGIVRRLGAGTTLLPGCMAIGATGQPEYAFEVARATGRELKALGINFNLAPVLDVNNNPHNPVIGVRSYGEEPYWVAACGVQAIKGLQAANVATCGKHFPGHGDTAKDSHLTLPMIPHDKQRLEQVELVPFVRAIAEGVDPIMIAHVCFPVIEPDTNVPATMSRRVITDLLRGELGFQGVVTTDCMEMHAISKTIGTVEGTYQAFKAGIDLAFISHTHELQEEAIERLVQGIEAGEVTEERLDESVARILALKEKYDSWNAWLPLFAKEDLVPDALVGGEEHQELARRVMEEAATLTKNDAGVLPLQVDAAERIGVVCLKNVLLSPVEDDRYLINPVQQAVEAAHRNVCAVEVSNNPSHADIDNVLAAMDGCATVIIGTLNAHLLPQQVELVKRLNALDAPLIVISMRTPYDLGAFAEVQTHIAAYEFTPVAAEIAVEAIFGRRKLQGHLPVTLPGLFSQGHYVVVRSGKR